MQHSQWALDPFWLRVTTCKEVIDLKNVLVNVACAAVIGYGVIGAVATVVGIAYYAYVDFIR